MKYVDVYTQEDMERVLGEGDRPVCRGDKRFVARGSAHVVAWDSAHVVARDSAHVGAWGSAHVVAWDSAHVVARDSAHVVAGGSAHVVAWGSAHVVARGSAHVVAWDSAHVVAGKLVAVHRHSRSATVSGGVLIEVEKPGNLAEWCDRYGATAVDGVVTLYKALDKDLRSPHGMVYEIGSQPEAPDWDGGEAECGGGLHFSAHPLDALSFHREATRFVACPVAVEDIVVHPDAQYPAKVKARRVCGPIVEVDRYGQPLPTVQAVETREA